MDRPEKVEHLNCFADRPLIPLNSTGAFVGCAEDENSNLRKAVLKSLAEITRVVFKSRFNEEYDFLVNSISHIVDMMTDEKDNVRIFAMSALQRVLCYDPKLIKLQIRDVQIMALNCEDTNKSIRKKCRELYAHCCLSDRSSLRFLIQSIFGCVETHFNEYAECMECLAKVARNNADILMEMETDLLGDSVVNNLDNPLYACTIRMVYEAMDVLGSKFDWILTPSTKQSLTLIEIQVLSQRKTCDTDIEMTVPSMKDDGGYYGKSVILFNAGLPTKIRIRGVLKNMAIENRKLFARITYPDGNVEVEEIGIRKSIRHHFKIFSRKPWTSPGFLEVCLGYYDLERFVNASGTAKVLVQAK